MAAANDIEKGNKLERLPSAPKIHLAKSDRANFPTKKFRMNSLLWSKPIGNAVSTTSSFLAQLFPTLVVNIAALSIGLGYGSNSIIVSQLMDNEESFTNVDENAYPWIAVMYGLGAAVGGIASSLIANNVGHRRLIMFLTGPDVVGWAMMTGAVNFHMILIGRFLTGFCAAGYLLSILIYVSEIAQPQHRGTLTAITIPSIAIGILLSHILGSFIPWNMVAVVGLVISIMIFPGLFLIANSPLWYLQQGQDKLALKAMEKFRASDANGLAELLATASTLSQNQDQYQDAPSTLKDRLASYTHRRNRRPFLILNSLCLLMILSGELPVSHYAVELFHEVSSFSAVIVAAIKLASSLACIPAIKYCSRKVLLTWTSIVMGISLASLGLVMRIQTDYTDLPIWIQISCVTLFISAAPLGLGSVPFVLMGEFFAAGKRSVLGGLTIALIQLEALVVMKTFPMVSSLMGDGALFWMYAAFCFVAAVFTLIFVPETKDMSLEEIKSHFDKKRQLHVTPYATPVLPRRNNNGRPHPLQSIQFTL